MAAGFFFILGAGASVDSGLPTYRGPDGMYSSCPDEPSRMLSILFLLQSDGPKKFWDYKRSFYLKVNDSKPGPTYQKLNQLIQKFPMSFVLTQNVDGHAKTLNTEVVEIHGNWSTSRCLSCSKIINTMDVINPEITTCSCGGWYRPNVILFDENLGKEEVERTYRLCKRCPKYVVVVGTTLQFEYLRVFIDKCKQRGAKVIHINPDDEYGINVKKNERWIRKTAAEGLQDLIHEFILN